MNALAIRGSWARYVPAIAFGYFALAVAVRLAVPAVAELDEAEQLLRTQSLEWGYLRQPPLYTWLQSAMFAATGVSVAGLSLLKNALLALTVILAWAIARAESGDARTGAIAAAGLFLIPQIAFESQRTLADTVLVTAATLATIWLMAGLARERRTAAYLALGLCLAAGILAKWNFGLIAVGLLAAALLVPDYRRIVTDRRMTLALAVCALIVWRPLLWQLDNADLAYAAAGKLQAGASGDPLGDRAVGLLNLAGAILGIAVLLLVVYAVAARRALVQAADGVRRSAFLRWLVVAMAIGLAGCLAAVLLFRVTGFVDRWLQPVLCALPLVLAVGGREALAGRAGRRVLVAGLVIAALVPPILLLRPIVGPAIGEPVRHNVPFPAFAAEIRALGFEDGVVLARDHYTGGNLRLAFPDATVRCAGLCPAVDLPPAPHDLLLAWRGGPGDRVHPGVARQYEALYGPLPGTVDIRTIARPIYYGDETETLRVVLLRGRDPVAR